MSDLKIVPYAQQPMRLTHALPKKKQPLFMIDFLANHNFFFCECGLYQMKTMFKIILYKNA